MMSFMIQLKNTKDSLPSPFHHMDGLEAYLFMVRRLNTFQYKENKT